MARVVKPPKPKRRRIRISASHPIWAEVFVCRHDGEDTWTIESVRSYGIDGPTARSLMESMCDADLDEMDRKANEAEDIE